MAAITLVTAVFALSLAGAVILFRFFKSTALVRRRTYQAGGALAGCLIIYGMLFGSAYHIERLNNQKLIAEVKDLRELLKNQELTLVSGMVEPHRAPVKIRLVFDDLEPDSKEGRFTFRVPRLLLDNVSPNVEMRPLRNV